MAEQTSHNVVNQVESTNGSAPFADVAENHTDTISAEPGKQSSSTADPSLSIAIDSRTPGLTERASQSNAEPSAGNAAPQLSAKIHALDDGKVANGVRDSQYPDDHALQDVSADPSVASDNDGSAADQAKDDTLQNRSNSVKKPATFSRVSVTKNFLARSAASPPVVVKLGDKAAPVTAAQSAALRPRLVAKTAASLSNISRARLGNEAGNTTPDAGTVWNKNRPAPTLPPKQFTDEELKQQYGIHLATRLQSDDGGKGSKWADIDDDEDDWAPEAVVWMDGTKTTLNSAETAAAAATPLESISAAPIAASADAPRPTMVLSKPSTQASTTAKTILKPGAATQAKQQSGTSLATSAEKHVLIAKSPAATPAKSPWASLPPVQSVSPINPPVQVQNRVPAPFPSQDARAGDPNIISNHPAREIAADTFDRSWPSVEGETRELFNSASGKYEPAPEGRRNSIRFDRKHAVLRRPSHGVSGAEAPWPHRRGSSVSQHSGPIQRPISVAQSVESHGVLSATSGHDREAATNQLASGTSAWAQQLPPPPAGEVAEDPVKVQERIMREKREAARVRRQEEEAQEEAAKQARLKAKLDALAGAGLSRKERQQATSSADVAASTVAEAETKPANTDVAQAQPAVEEESQPQAEATLSPPAQHAAVAEPSPRLTQREQLASSAASRSTFQSQVSGSYQTAPSSTFSSPGDRERKPQPFGRAALQNHDGFSSAWPSAGTGNVWGVKGIGNGTFESAFAPISSHQNLSLPLPPGMSRPATNTRVSPQAIGSSGHSPSLQDAQLAAELNRSTPTPDLDLIPDHFKHHSSIPNQSMGRQQHVPGPIGPPSRTQPQHQQRDQISSWQSAAQQLPAQYSLDAAQGRHEALSDDVRRNNNRFKETFKQTSGSAGGLGGPRRYDRIDFTVHDNNGSAPVPPSTQTQSILPSGQLDTVYTSGHVRLPDTSRAPTSGHRQEVLPPHLASKVAYTTAPLAPGPQANDELPPPPEISSHPVYDGEHYRPNVRLPPPPAVVKLPPAMAAHLSSSPLVSQRHNFGQLGGARPIVQNEAWQARFNGLFNRAPIQTEIPPSPPKTPPKPSAASPALEIASSTRAVMDESFAGPTVSLPTSRLDNKSAEGFIIDNSSAPTSKKMVQGMFNEELGFGSRPLVRIARNVQRHHRSPAKYNLLAMRTHPKDFTLVKSQSQPDLPVFFLFYKKPEGYFVKLPGSGRNMLVRSQRAQKHVIAKVRPSLPPKPTSAKPNEPAADSKVSTPAGPLSSRKSSTPKQGASANAAVSSPLPTNKGESATPAPKPLRKRSSHHKGVPKSAATEKPAAIVKAS